MIKYVFKDAPLTIKAADKADAQKIGEALAKITEAGGGHLKPAAVVEAARNPRNVLHRHFEWDDRTAAEAYRLGQAREIVRIIRVEDGTADPKPAFFSISDKGGTSYRTLSDVQRSVDLQSAVMRQAQRDLVAFEHRYRELTDICEVVREARERLDSRLEKSSGAEKRAAA